MTGLMFLRSSYGSSTRVPISACFRANAICSSMYFDFLMPPFLLLVRIREMAGFSSFRWHSF